jgi:hypothetical protein
LCRNLNATVETASSDRPVQTVNAGPPRTASMPPGKEPTSVPIALLAVSTSADSFERCNSVTSPGSSGAITA